MVYGKLDTPLAARVRALERTARAGTDSDAGFEGRDRVTVLVRIAGPDALAAAEEAGLATEFHTARVAVGTVAVGDLLAVASATGVEALRSNRQMRPLEVPDLPTGLMGALAGRTAAGHARAGRAAGPVSTLSSEVTGRGVLVGIIDTGIDIFHPCFIKPGNPKQTRIVSLLDLTLRQTISCQGSPTGGVLAVRWKPPGTAPEASTVPLNLPVTAAALQTALEALPNPPSPIRPGDFTVSGGPLPETPVVVDFTGQFDSRHMDSADISRFRLDFQPTGGTNPKMIVTPGRAITPAEINAALQGPFPPFISRDMKGHGTSVAGVAAGTPIDMGCCTSDIPIGVATGADLVVVRSPLTDAENLQGVQYLLDQPWLAPGTPKQPVVINMSFGNSAGAGDGTDPFEIMLDDLLTDSSGRAMTIAAGNEGDLYTPPAPGTPLPVPRAEPGGGQHTFRKMAANSTFTFRFAVEDNDKKSDTLRIWYPGPGKLDFTMTAPASTGTTTTPPALPAVIHPAFTPTTHAHTFGSTDVYVTSYLLAPGTAKRLIEVRLLPLAPSNKIAMGTYSISLTETEGIETTFDCWIDNAKDDPPGRFVAGDQIRSRTVCSPGTARLPVTVGAYNTDGGQLAGFSGRGPTTDLRVKPEVCGPGVAVPTAKNLGQPPNPHHMEYGTSMAAPYVAGVIALMLQVNKNLDHVNIKKILQDTCDKPVPPVPPTQLDSGWGYGRVNAENAVKAVPPPTATAADAEPGAAGPLILPVAAYPAAHLPPAELAERLKARAGGTPAGRRAAALIAAHHTEVTRLATTDRRILVAWHRMHGPLLLRRLLLGEADFDTEAPLPATLDGTPAAEGLARLLDALARAASPALRADIAAHRAFLLALPGALLSDLDLDEHAQVN
ncbi:S8 family serine peptidase [Streptomyces sp. NPDC050504]|uniref:S8 family serine peptidase n=1 Tax=Streptomyces sp. NPDC050504 TaxID=3365618 RepID=UPI0037A5BAF3